MISTSTHLKSPAHRIFTFVALTFFSLTVYFIAQNFFSMLHQAEAQTLGRLHSLANSIAIQIDGDAHDKMMQSYGNKDAIVHTNTDTIYARIHAILQKQYQVCGLKSPVYTFIYDEQKKNFAFGVTSSDEPYFRHQYSSPPQCLMDKKETGGTIDMYEDEFGSWLSAFATIRNKEGKVVALLQVDERFNDFKAQLNSLFFKNVAIGLFVFSLFIIALLKYLKNVLAREQSYKKDLTEAYKETKALSETLVEHEEELKKYATRLEQSNRELTDFANIASHDLKAPVRGIQSFVQLIEKRSKHKFDERDLEFFNFIKTNARQSLNLIESLLNYSKADKNIGDPSVMTVDKSIDMALFSLTNIIEDKACDVTVGNMPTILAHPTLIAQLFQNLINNGIKYNQSTPPKIEIQAQYSEQEGYIFSVKDNGIGIPEQYKKDVFAMFRRLHNAGEYEGSGIGLAFCKRIIDTYEGKIWLDSEVGKGSVFYFTLPKAFMGKTVEEAQPALEMA